MRPFRRSIPFRNIVKREADVVPFGIAAEKPGVLNLRELAQARQMRLADHLAQSTDVLSRKHADEMMGVRIANESYDHKISFCLSRPLGVRGGHGSGALIGAAPQLLASNTPDRPV
ncbi:MAG: hypothetical protein HUJ24_00120 [Rhodobacteraceae bacterium]|nr:hypothetical protein [Paracoccaceae bacterium]